MTERHFLPWNRPLLVAACDWLLELAGDEADLSHVDLLCAGRRASRGLFERIVTSADARGGGLDPPEILTPSQWVDRRLAASGVATDLDLELAWRASLAEATDDTHRELGSPSRAAANWSARLAQLGRDLGREELSFSDAARVIATLDLGDREAARWRALANLEQDVRERLRRAGRVEPLLARRDAEPSEGRRVVCVGLVELPRAARRLIESMPDSVVLVHAPAELAEDFDEFGLPIPERWTEKRLPLKDEQIHVAEDPVQAAALCVRRLAERARELGDQVPSAEEITIGVVDEECVAPLQEMLLAREQPVRDARGTPAARQALLRSLKAIERLLRDDDFDSLLVFVQDPVVENWLRGPDDSSPLEQLHDFRRRHLPEKIGLRLDSRERGAAIAHVGRIRELFGELLGQERALSQWPLPIAHAVEALLQHEPLDPEHPGGRHAIQMLSQLREILDELARTPPELDLALGADEALRMVIDRLERVALPLAPERGAIELVGWLELAHDDAEHVFLLGANEGQLPASNALDPFLPESLRRHLKLPDARTRYARDLYWLTTLLESRPTTELFLAKRRLSGDPLLPSRLLFACEREELPQRVHHALKARAGVGGLDAGWSPADDDDQRVSQAPELREWLRPMKRISVTGFADYLASPYRFHLRHGLKLRDRAANTVGELDAPDFGTLLHQVLKEFGLSELRDSTDVERVREYLRHALYAIATDRFGERPHATLRLQFETARDRLERFAAWQVERAADGWRIDRCEFEVERQHARLEVDGEDIELRGRIDRLDRHRDGQLAVIDYKVRDSATGDHLDPRKAHLNKHGWKDLQLPLYDMLIRRDAKLEATASVESAFLNLTPEGCSYREVIWSPEEREGALEVARSVVREIREGIVPPPDPAAGRRFPELSSITRDSSFRDVDADDEGPGDA